MGLCSTTNNVEAKQRATYTAVFALVVLAVVVRMRRRIIDIYKYIQQYSYVYTQYILQYMPEYTIFSFFFFLPFCRAPHNSMAVMIRLRRYPRGTVVRGVA